MQSSNAHARDKKHFPRLRWLIKHMLLLERRYVAKIKNSALLSKITHSYLFSFNQKPLGRGIAIGMFWMCMPMPFQMLPALFFCWLGFANLPVAIILVWISNPFTYVPFFYLEYKIGMLLFDNDIGEIISFNEFAARYGDIANLVGDYYFVILKGSVVLGVVLALVGYFASYPLDSYIKRLRFRHRK